MTTRDRPDGDYLHNCAMCQQRFSGYKGDRLCMVCLPTLMVQREPACPCQAPRICLLCGRNEPCGLLGPGAEPGDAPICTMEPETYAELIARVRAAYDAATKLRADKAQALTALAGMVRLFCCDGGQPLAEHSETIAAVRVLAAAGMCVIVKDATDEVAGGWLEATWAETPD